MTETLYTIDYRPRDNVLQFSMHGFWTMDTLRIFEGKLLERAQQVSRTTTKFDMLSDASDFPIQSAEVIGALSELSAALSAMNTGRFAIVAQSVLGKLQAERSISSLSMKVFLDKDSAVAWLSSAAD